MKIIKVEIEFDLDEVKFCLKEAGLEYGLHLNENIDDKMLEDEFVNDFKSFSRRDLLNFLKESIENSFYMKFFK